MPVRNLDALDVKRFGDKSLENFIRTDTRYGHDGLFQGPRGWGYWNYLEYPRPIQNPNLWPDMQSTYFIGTPRAAGGREPDAELHLPARALLPVRALQGRARHLRLDRRGPLGRADRAGPGLDQPVPGRRQPARRQAQLHAADRRREPAGGQGQAACAEHAVRRQGRRRPDVRQPRLSLRPGQRRRRLGPGGYARRRAPGCRPTPARSPTARSSRRPRWSSSSAGPCRRPSRRSPPSSGRCSCTRRTTIPRSNPATAPARKDPKWEKYWNIRYSILGSFKTPEERAKIPYASAIDGGGDPETQYMFVQLSRKFGPVYVMRGKMPTFPEHLRRRRRQGAGGDAGGADAVLVARQLRGHAVGADRRRADRHAGAAR